MTDSEEPTTQPSTPADQTAGQKLDSLIAKGKAFGDRAAPKIKQFGAIVAERGKVFSEQAAPHLQNAGAKWEAKTGQGRKMMYIAIGGVFVMFLIIGVLATGGDGSKRAVAGSRNPPTSQDYDAKYEEMDINELVAEIERIENTQDHTFRALWPEQRKNIQYGNKYGASLSLPVVMEYATGDCRKAVYALCGKL